MGTSGRTRGTAPQEGAANSSRVRLTTKLIPNSIVSITADGGIQLLVAASVSKGTGASAPADPGDWRCFGRAKATMPRVSRLEVLR